MECGFFIYERMIIMKDVQKLLRSAEKPAKLARKLHTLYRGKIEMVPKCRIKDFNDFAIWYTPGVAVVCKDIEANKELAYEYTNKWNSIAIVTDGSRVLGLGDIGPEAGLPVMEGKALLFKYLGGVDAIPLCLSEKDPAKFIETVKNIQPSFGGINLEDIEQPKCFGILDTLRKECAIPVWHDDQQGTALVTLAGLINALKIVNKKISDIRIALVGAGAANICIARLLMIYGANPGKIVLTDSRGILNRSRAELKGSHPQKWEMCLLTNATNLSGGIKEAMEGADVLIALSTPGPGVIKKEWVSAMAKKSVVFACANPIPEIWPWEAKEAGAAVVATGRSDFANQVNNSLGFPGVFRGTLDVRAKTITNEMCIEAALELSNCIKPSDLSAKKLLPTMDDWEVYPRVASAVGTKAIEQNIAAKKMSRQAIYDQAKQMILRSRNITKTMMQKGLIKVK
jgi:malate dehydrogenase (oxaloacetate-decarboxylating)